MLTYQKLAISEQELNTLIIIRDNLKTGTFVHGGSYWSGDKPGFNMDSFHCGTSGCIGGWMALINAGGALNAETMRVSERLVNDQCHNFSSALYSLFYPECETRYVDITPDEAVEAIDNFLNTGKPEWREVLEEPPLEEPDYDENW